MARGRFPRSLAVGVLLLAACDLMLPWSSGPSAGDTAPGSFVVSPSSLSVTTFVGHPSHASLVAEVSGVSGIAYLIVESNGTVVAGSVIAPGAFRAAVTVDLLPVSAAGTYQTQLDVSVCMDSTCAPGSRLAGSPVRVPLTLEVRAAQLTATPSAVALDWVRGTPAPASRSIVVAEVSAGAALGVLVQPGFDTTPGGWLTVNGVAYDSTVQTPGAVQLGTVPFGLPAGLHTGRLRLSGSGSLVEVPVSLQVTDPAVTATPGVVTFSAVSAVSGVPAGKTVALSSPDVAGLAVTTEVVYAPGASGWLAVPASLALPGSLAIQPSRQDLPAGDYAATVRLLAEGQLLAAIDVGYTLTTAVVTANPTALSFEAVRLGPPPAARALALATASAPRVPVVPSVEYPAGVTPWLSVLGNAAPGDLSVAPTSTALAVGTYTATVVVRDLLGVRLREVPITYVVDEPAATFQPTSVEFSAVQGQAVPPADRFVVVGTRYDAPLTFTVAVSYGPGAAGWLAAPAGGTAPTGFYVRPNRTDLPTGTYAATVEVKSADGVVRGSFPVSYVVTEPPIFATPGTVTFSMLQGQAAPAPVTVALATTFGQPVAYLASVEYDEPGNWLSFPSSGAAPGTLAVQPTGSLPFGMYTARVRLRSAAGDELGGVVVRVTVGTFEFSTAPGQLNFVVGPATTPAGLTRTLAISTNGVPTDFTVTVPDWASVSPATGNTATVTQLTVSLKQDQLMGMNLWVKTDALHFALTPPGASAPIARDVFIGADVRLPSIARATPFGVAEGDTSPVLVHGLALGLLEPGQLTIGGVPATGLTILGPKDARVVPPVLPPGRHAVVASNALGVPLGGGMLDVLAVGAAPAGSGPSAPGVRTRIIRDDVRGALYAANTAGFLERWRDANGHAREALALPGVTDVALTPDGAVLVALSPEGIWEVDPVAFTLPAGPTYPQFFSDVVTDVRVACAADGNAVVASHGAIVTSSWLYDVGADALGSLAHDLARAEVAASRDGALVVALRDLAAPLRYNGFRLEAMPGAATLHVDGATLDRTGARWLPATVGAEGVLDAAGLPVPGRLPSGAVAAVLTDDGQRAVTLDATDHVHVFDVSAPMPAATDLFPEVGLPGGAVLPVSPGSGTRLAISVDGTTLYAVGATALVVFPLP